MHYTYTRKINVIFKKGKNVAWHKQAGRYLPSNVTTFSLPKAWDHRLFLRTNSVQHFAPSIRVPTSGGKRTWPSLATQISSILGLLSHPACLLLLLLSSAHVAPSLHAKSKNPMAWTDEVEQETYSSQGALALNDHMTV